MGAVHGNDVAVVDRPGRVAGVDALVTREADLALVALAADCVPLALIGDDGLTLAAVHCGWRGLVSDVVGTTEAVLADLGAAIGQVVIGPSVCGRCYPVPDDRAEAVARAWPGDVAAAALVTCADGQPGIDVGRGVQARLVELGVSPDRITVVPGCTAEDPALFSFRRDGVTGRQGIVIARMGS
jgi:YfiH family protein